jgi:predicted small lipoprotein YifL
MTARRIWRAALALLLALAIAAPLGACGKKGKLEPPDEKSDYPRTYPRE